MPAPESSRKRFQNYQAQVRDRHRGRAVPVGNSNGLTDFTGANPLAEIRVANRANRNRSFGQLFAAFWQMVSGHRAAIVASLVLMSVGVLLGLVPPAATKLAIDCALTQPPHPLPPLLAHLPLPETPMRLLLIIAGCVVLVTILATSVRLASRWQATKAVNRAQVTIRNQVFQQAVRLPLHRIYGMKSGGVASLIREDAGGVADLIFSMLYNPGRAVIQFVGSLAILTLVDWKLMAGGLLLLPAVWATHRTWIARVRPLFRDIRRQRQRIDSMATETFGGIRVVRTFGRARSEASRFVREGDFMVRQQLFTWWRSRVIEVVWEVLIPLASTALLLYGGYRILQGHLTLGDLMMFLVYLTMLLDPLATLAGSAVTFQNNLAGLDRILDVMQQPGELSQMGQTQPIDAGQVRGEICLQDVSFRYPETDTDVLQHITLTIPAGKTVALVGRSGAGKTTLTNLIARFYNPTAGTITLDGRPLPEIGLDSYRRLLGMVEQDVFLFDGTIRENIAYARRGASEQAVVEAAKQAAADDFICRLPEGYDTVIGERGVKLSGGQRQRLAIARALLADPKILILDEATSSLDSESEQLIQQSLQRLLKNRTAVVIAHRLSTIRHADLIVILGAGCIMETGTHRELLQADGEYRKMIYLQNTAPVTTDIT